MPSEIRYVAANGVQLGYQVFSEGSGKPAAIFVHGYSGRSTKIEAYEDLLAALAAHFTLYALDARGHGASAAVVHGFSLEAIGDDIAAFTEALQIVAPLYIGHSLGGLAGLFCEIRHPRTFSAMCLLASGAARGGGISDLFIHHGRDREFLRNALRPNIRNEAHLNSHVEAVTLIDRCVHEEFHAQFSRVDILAEIPTITIPVLALNGAADSVVVPALQHETAMALPNCKEVIVAKLGHNFPCDAPDLSAREIIAFFQHDCSTQRSGATA